MGTTFYFNIDNDHLELDPEGTEVKDADQARREAIALAAQMLMNGSGEALCRGKSLKVWVTNAPNGTGDVLFTLQVSAS